MTSLGQWNPVYMAENPMKKAFIMSVKPSLYFSKKIGRDNPNTSIVVVEGKEQVLVCHIPIVRVGRTSKGLVLLTTTLIIDPRKQERGPEKTDTKLMTLAFILDSPSFEAYRMVYEAKRKTINDTMKLHVQAKSRMELLIPKLVSIKSFWFPTVMSTNRRTVRTMTVEKDKARSFLKFKLVLR